MDPQTSKRPPGDMEPDCSESAEVNPNLALKKHKLDNKVSPITIQNLPSEVLVKIFEHLNFEERLRAQRICSKWRQVLRTELNWQYGNFSNISSSYFIGILMSLPPCLEGIRLRCIGDTFPISLLQIISKLNQKCSSLKSLILEKMGLEKKFYIVTAHKTIVRNTIELPGQFIETEFCNKDIVMLNAFLSELQVLSLRKVMFDPLHIPYISSSTFPSLRVLDLSYSRPVYITHILNDDGLFSTLVDLEELYLGGWLINDESLENFLKNAKKLRVLDVQFCSVTNKTAHVLIENNKCLEKLCISGTKISDFDNNIEDEELFPDLELLCARNTEVTPDSLENLLIMCPLLNKVYVNDEKVHKRWYQRLTREFRDRVCYEKTIQSISYCDHFRRSTTFLKFKC